MEPVSLRGEMSSMTNNRQFRTFTKARHLDKQRETLKNRATTTEDQSSVDCKIVLLHSHLPAPQV